MTMEELRAHNTAWYYPFMFGIAYTSDIAPDANNVVGIGVRNTLWAFSNTGRIFKSTAQAPDWVEISTIRAASGLYSLEENIPSGGFKSVTITFDKAFSNTPNVCAALVYNTDSAAMSKVSVYVKERYQDHFTFTIQNGSDNTVRPAVNWIAMTL